MGRVLVTGASGLIGRAVVDLFLARGETVVISTREPLAQRDGLLGIPVDLTLAEDRARLVENAQADRLIHLAWPGGKERWHGDANAAWIDHSLDLFRRFSSAGGQRIVGVGSCAEYDWSNSVLSEDSPLNPASVYGQAKAATGAALLAEAGDLGVSAAWARLSGRTAGSLTITESSVTP